MAGSEQHAPGDSPGACTEEAGSHVPRHRCTHAQQAGPPHGSCDAGRWHFCSQAAADRQQLDGQFSKWQAPGSSGYSFSLSPFPPSLSSLSSSIFSLYNCSHLVASDICLSVLSLLPILGCGLHQGSSFRRKVSLAGWCPMLHPPIIKGVWCRGRFALNYRARDWGPQH